MEFTETLLPGVGVRYDGQSRDGQPIAIVVAHDGDVEIVTYQRTDPDAVQYRLELAAHAALAVAELLGSPRVSARLVDLTREIPGLHTRRLVVAPGSRYAGRLLGDSKARTRTGCSIVAVVRGPDVIAAPAPDFTLLAGDTLIAIGSERGLEALAELLGLSPDDPAPVMTAPV